MRWFTGKSKIPHDPPEWAEYMEMALYFHVPPWQIEKELTLTWYRRWLVWKEEQPDGAH